MGNSVGSKVDPEGDPECDSVGNSDPEGSPVDGGSEANVGDGIMSAPVGDVVGD